MRVTHKYDDFGEYNGSLTARDASGNVSNSAYVPITVTVNHPPRAVAGLDRIAAPGEQLSFDGGASLDPDNDTSVIPAKAGIQSDGISVGFR